MEGTERALKSGGSVSIRQEECAHERRAGTKVLGLRISFSKNLFLCLIFQELLEVIGS